MGKATIIEAQNSNTVYEEGKSSGILGKLKGVFADYKNGTRNSDRLYCEELWDNRVFGNEDVMEALQTKTLFGELDHPEGDRCETLAKNAAITITKLEKNINEGVIYGEAEILDTPTGRIVKSLADSGAKLGISSRGMGEEIYSEGRNIIDPETYDFITFDVVVTPANTKARVSLTESKSNNKLTESFKKEINESETNNQLNQIKVALKNSNLSDKTDLINLVEHKKNRLEKNIKLSTKLQEKNKDIALNLLKQKLNEQIELTNEYSKAGEALASENTKLTENLSYYEESKAKLKTKLKEALSENNKQKMKIQESDQELSKLEKLNESLNNTKVMNENNQKINKQLMQENTSIKEENKTLLEQNAELSKKIKHNSKILTERINKLEKQLTDNNKKLTESKKAEANTISQLKEQIALLESKNQKMQEAQDRLSHLSFDSIGHRTVVAENFKNEDNYTQEELNLFNALI